MSCKTQLGSFIILILTTFLPLAISQNEKIFCSTNGNYTSESLYRSDLNSLLRSLSSNIDNTGFYNATKGQANVIALCRADLQLNEYQSWLNILASDIIIRCPNQFQAVMWNEYCMVRYSNTTILRRLATDPAGFVSNSNKFLSPYKFKDVRTELMDDVRTRAANGGPLRKAAAGNRTGPDDQEIYTLLQCTPDLSPENCTSCLVEAEKYNRGHDDNAVGFRVYMPSCFYRYEPYLFYNTTKLGEPLAPAPPLPPLVPPPPPPPAGKNRMIIIIIASVVAFLFLFLVLGVSIFARKRMKHKEKKKINHDFSGEVSTVESIQHDFGKIRAATNDFSDDNKLGQGGFGAVYMGKLVNGQEIAVKRLSKDSGQGDLEFKNEVLLLAKLQHRNLVRLLGFSIEGVERLLVYEFVRNGSLDHCLFDRIKSVKLDWNSRYRIIVGIAKGVLYLHEDSRLTIIHRDLKASNVLLDEHMNPKIADFGMAKLVVPDATQESTSRIVGTYGYMAPEYAIYGHFSVKSDVFSFGVIILEIITGQRKIFVQNGENLDLLSYAWRSWREGTTANMIDPILGATSGSQRDMMRCVHIALLCVQENAADRPTMASVVLMLNSFSMSLPMPSKPGFYFSRSSVPHQEYNSKQFESNTQSALFSTNEYSSIKDLYST